MDIPYILYGVIAIFFIILILRNFLPLKKREKICSICLATTITWISLLLLHYFGRFENIAIISLLMGMTLLGVFYTIEKNVKKELTFFRLPFLLSLIMFGYYAITLEDILKELILILVLWIIFGLIYSYRSNPSFNKFVNKIIECCKKW